MAIGLEPSPAEAFLPFEEAVSIPAQLLTGSESQELHKDRYLKVVPALPEEEDFHEQEGFGALGWLAVAYPEAMKPADAQVISQAARQALLSHQLSLVYAAIHDGDLSTAQRLSVCLPRAIDSLQ